MTEINNIKSGGQVVSLKSANAQATVKNGGAEQASGSAASSRPPLSLVSGQDPLEQAARAIEDFVPEEANTKLRINKDDDTGRFIYQNVDKESGEVVSQFPPETIMEMISHFRSLEGLVVDDDA